MRTLNIKDFGLGDFTKITSEFVSDTFSTFLDNFLYLFDGFKRLNEKHTIYRTVADETFDYLYGKIATTPTDNIMNGYEAPDSNDNVNIKHGFGTITLEESNAENLIPLVSTEISSEISDVANDDEGNMALSGARIYKLDGTWLESADLRRVIDDTGYIWYEYTANTYMDIKLTLPGTSAKVSYIEIYPYGGTMISSVTFNGASDDVFDIEGNNPLGILALIEDGFPVRLHVNKDDFTNEINIKLKGKLSGIQYFYSLGYIKVYYTDYVDSGTISYGIGTPATITDVSLAEPYIYPDELHAEFPIDIKIVSNDVLGTVTVYDTSDSSGAVRNDYPLNEDLIMPALPGGATEWDMIYTLKKTQGFSPVFRKCEIVVT